MVQYEVISVSDLKEALKYSDSYMFKNVSSREMARQLLLAETITLAIAEILGNDALKKVPVYKEGAAIGIIELEGMFSSNVDAGTTRPVGYSFRSFTVRVSDFSKVRPLESLVASLME